MPYQVPNNIRDYNLENLTALPSAAGTVNSASIDLGSTTPGPLVETGLTLEVNLPATPNLANAATITVTIQDSADNSSFAAVANVSTIGLLGAGGVGAAAKNVRLPLPNTVRRYVRASAVQVSTGDNSAVQMRFAAIQPIKIGA
jgi:hypothetical protein